MPCHGVTLDPQGFRLFWTDSSSLLKSQLPLKLHYKRIIIFSILTPQTVNFYGLNVCITTLYIFIVYGYYLHCEKGSWGGGALCTPKRGVVATELPPHAMPMAKMAETLRSNANESEIVKSLKDVDLKSLCREAVERGLIPQDVMKSLESMDWETSQNWLRY